MPQNLDRARRQQIKTISSIINTVVPLSKAALALITDVFFQGVRQFERVLKPEYEGKTDDDLRFEVGPDFERECYVTVPTKQWLKPSDQLVIKMLESWHRKRYGARQTIDVN